MMVRKMSWLQGVWADYHRRFVVRMKVGDGAKGKIKWYLEMNVMLMIKRYGLKLNVVWAGGSR